MKWLDFDWCGNRGGFRNKVGEVMWLFVHGEHSFCIQRPWSFRAGRVWYDGPIWFLNIGPFQWNVAA